MKIRNKKTGEIVDLSEGFIKDTYNGEFIQIKPVAISNKEGYLYGSLAELNEDWEDYKPAEPLIKDEKIRKAVRAWAESLRLQEVYCASNGYEIYGGIDEWAIQFEGEPFPFADKNKIYSIDELCGEEEE